jgi:hypothetical protein
MASINDSTLASRYPSNAPTRYDLARAQKSLDLWSRQIEQNPELPDQRRELRLQELQESELQESELQDSDPKRLTEESVARFNNRPVSHSPSISIAVTSSSRKNSNP